MPAKVQCSQILLKCKLHPVISPHKSLYSFPSAVRIKLNCLAWFSRLTRPGSCQALQARVFLLSSLTHHTLSLSPIDQACSYRKALMSICRMCLSLRFHLTCYLPEGPALVILAPVLSFYYPGLVSHHTSCYLTFCCTCITILSPGV